ncbi:MAG: class I SAM-dependent methyltransferase [Candidatus Eremiobacteraeota bacterium]|nr:class I SAM-dependent methyltransferase [Candidatus Eremiobacteraeota bacterium]MBC5823934.1 class I SAM-dependent methyltransferase [Candidatus Eremiobacteraeota bacterium]
MYSRAVVDYVSFESLPRKFYLMDTFEGMPSEQFSAKELAAGLREWYRYGDMFESTQAHFKTYPNVVFVKGSIPDTLSSVTSEKIAYLSIDMNAAAPEIAAAEYFWDRLVPGAVIVLDDYGWRRHFVQKQAFDEFAAARSVSVLTLPTGQGIIIKP